MLSMIFIGFCLSLVSAKKNKGSAVAKLNRKNKLMFKWKIDLLNAETLGH